MPPTDPNKNPGRNPLADTLSAMASGQPLPAPSDGGAAQPVPGATDDETLVMAAYRARLPHGHRHPPADLYFRQRTLIPILLTGGVILVGIAIFLRTSTGDEGLYEAFPHWTWMVMILGGVLAIALAIVNMKSVSRGLARIDTFGR